MPSDLPPQDSSGAIVLFWRAAATDLDLIVIAPFILRHGGDSHEFPALIRHFGSPSGAVVLQLGAQDEEYLSSIARKAGYFTSALGKSYESYDRQLAIDTLNDWRWCGPLGEGPEWYSGEPWTEANS